MALHGVFLPRFHFQFSHTQKKKIEELRMSVSRAEQQLAWKEDRMNQEMANIQTVSETVSAERFKYVNSLLFMCYRGYKKLMTETKS